MDIRGSIQRELLKFGFEIHERVTRLALRLARIGGGHGHLRVAGVKTTPFYCSPSGSTVG
jgi:hypothetical protein